MRRARRQASSRRSWTSCALESRLCTVSHARHAVNTAYLANINQLLTPAGGSLIHVQKAGDTAALSCGTCPGDGRHVQGSVVATRDLLKVCSFPRALLNYGWAPVKTAVWARQRVYCRSQHRSWRALPWVPPLISSPSLRRPVSRHGQVRDAIDPEAKDAIESFLRSEDVSDRRDKT